MGKFIWDNENEDEELYSNGFTVLIVAGRTKAIQNFVEKLSYKIDSKCKIAFAGGRAHIDVAKESVDKAINAINDKEFMKQFIVPYSKESYNNETYFEII